MIKCTQIMISCFIFIIICSISSAKEIPLIPNDIFQTSEYLDEPSGRKNISTEKKYMIHWIADSRGCDLVLVIHPKQLFLRSISDNENPNRLYWLYDDLKIEQYKIISDYLDSKKATYLNEGGLNWGDYITSGFRLYLDSKERDSEDNFWLKTYSNLILLLWEFNKQLDGKTDLIKYPENSFITDRKTVLIREYPGHIPLEKIYINEKE